MNPPPPKVLRAFDAQASPTPLDGGQGTSWRSGSLVFKPVDDPARAEELATLVTDLQEDGFRLARPVRAVAGGFVVSGWSAWHGVEGCHADDRWPEVLDLSQRLERMLADHPRPAFLDRLYDPWVRAGQVAFGQAPVAPYGHRPDIAKLLLFLRPLAAARHQLIHHDLAGNVIFNDPTPPTVIDSTPGWRPVGYQTAVVAADAFLWHAADGALADQAVALVPDFDQLFVRAILFRLVVDAIFRPDDPGRTYLPVVERATRWVATRPA